MFWFNAYHATIWLWRIANDFPCPWSVYLQTISTKYDFTLSVILLKMVVRQSWLGKEHIALFSGVCLYTYNIYPRIMDLSGWQNMCVQNLFTPFLYLIDAIWVVECMQNGMEWMFRSEVDAKFQLKCEVQNAPTTPQKEEEERKKKDYACTVLRKCLRVNDASKVWLVCG